MLPSMRAAMGKAMDWFVGEGGTLSSYLAVRVVIAGSAMVSMAFVSIREDFWWGLGWLIWPAIYILDVVFRSRTYRQGYAAGVMAMTNALHDAVGRGETSIVVPDPPRMWAHRPFMVEGRGKLRGWEQDQANAPENYTAFKGL